MATHRNSITKALVSLIGSELNGTQPTKYYTNMYGNVSDTILHFSDVPDFPFIGVAKGSESIEYHAAGFRWNFLTLYIRVYVRGEDNYNEQLETVISDLKTLIDYLETFPYTVTTPSGLICNHKVTEVTFLGLDTDEGLLAPDGFGELRLQVRYEDYSAVDTYVNNLRSFESSFESANDFDGYYITPSGGTSFQEASTDIVISGTYAHKAWINGANPASSPGVNNNHRGYPTIQMYKDVNGSFTGPVHTSLWVWLDIDLSGDSGISEENWFSFATFTDDDTDSWDRTVLVNLDKQGFVHLQHTTGPGTTSPIFQTTTLTFPQSQWVKLDMYLDFSPVNGYAKVWQDGVLVSHHNVTNVDNRVSQAHFGLYCPPQLTTGTCYNDDLSIKMVTGEPAITPLTPQAADFLAYNGDIFAHKGALLAYNT